MSVAFDFLSDPRPDPRGPGLDHAFDPAFDLGSDIGRQREVDLARAKPATVTRLHRPAPATIAPPLRLTRRGACALAALVAALAVALVAFAWLSAPSPAGGAATQPAAQPAAVVVAPGDSLWSIAERVAPDRDPRAEVADLQRINHLDASELVPGQVLRTR